MCSSGSVQWDGDMTEGGALAPPSAMSDQGVPLQSAMTVGGLASDGV